MNLHYANNIIIEKTENLALLGKSINKIFYTSKIKKQNIPNKTLSTLGNLNIDDLSNNLIQFKENIKKKDNIISKLKTLEVVKELKNGFFVACGSKNNIYIFNEDLVNFTIINNSKNEEYINIGETYEIKKKAKMSIK